MKRDLRTSACSDQMGSGEDWSHSLSTAQKRSPEVWWSLLIACKVKIHYNVLDVNNHVFIDSTLRLRIIYTSALHSPCCVRIDLSEATLKKYFLPDGLYVHKTIWYVLKYYGHSTYNYEDHTAIESARKLHALQSPVVFRLVDATQAPDLSNQPSSQLLVWGTLETHVNRGQCSLE